MEDLKEEKSEEISKTVTKLDDVVMGGNGTLTIDWQKIIPLRMSNPRLSNEVFEHLVKIGVLTIPAENSFMVSGAYLNLSPSDGSGRCYAFTEMRYAELYVQTFHGSPNNIYISQIKKNLNGKGESL